MRSWRVLGPGCVLACALGCASAPVPPAEGARLAPEGSRTELLRPRESPRASAVLDEVVARLRDLAGRSSEPGPLLLRLAAAHQERAAAHGRAGAVAMEEGFAHRGDPDAEGEARAQVERHAAARVADLERARRVLESLGPSSPEHARARRALFWLLTERREWEADALAAARAILETEASGPLTAAAHLRLAEAAFEGAALDDALAEYEGVLATDGADAQTRAYASYKRAWVLFNLGRMAESDRAFAQVRAISAEAPGGDQLAREAAKDRVRVQVSLGSAPERVLTVITESTDDPALRASLATRYERMLRDAGQLARADAFRSALLR